MKKHILSKTANTQDKINRLQPQSEDDIGENNLSENSILGISSKLETNEFDLVCSDNQSEILRLKD